MSCGKDILKDSNFDNTLKDVEKRWNVVFPINFNLNETYGKANCCAAVV